MADEQRDRRSKRPSAAVILDRVRLLKEQALKQHNWDGGAFENVVDDMRLLPINDETRSAYEEVLDLMPSASLVWVRYLDLELGRDGNVEAAKQLFARCLLSCPTVPLYALYLKFIKRMNDGRGTQGVTELRQAYEFTLDVVGQDVNSGPLWTEYLQFLQAPKPGTPAFTALYPGTLEGQEEAARTPVVRRAFQRAVQVPSSQLEAIWRAYETWEVKVDKQLGRKVLDEWRPRFQAARNVLRDRKKRLEGIMVEALPLPPGQGGAFQNTQAQLWREYLDFELSNQQHLENDAPALAARISLAYGQCLTVLWFFPEAWYQYTSSQLSSGGVDAALAVLSRGQAALPGCSLLRFIHAELKETYGKVEEAKQVYDQVVDILDLEVPPGADAPPEPSGVVRPQLSPFGGEQGVLVWLQYIRFLRRTQGAGVARQAFLRARRWHQGSIALAPLQPPNEPESKSDKAIQPKCTGGQLYSGMARTEWTLDRGNFAVACRIFELGLEDPRLARDPSYVSSYAAFLIDAGDVDNARALFERALSESEVSAAVELWRTYAVMEMQQGNLSAALQVEERMRAALLSASEPGARPVGAPPPMHSSIASLQLAVCRFASEGVLPCESDHAPHLRRAAALAPAAPPSGDEGVGPRDAYLNGNPRGSQPSRVDRDRDVRGDRDRDREPRGRDREGSQDERGGPRGPPREDEAPPGGAPPDMIEMLISQLPAPMAVEGPLVPIDAVMDVVMMSDMSPATMAAVCSDLDVGNVPSGDNGVEVPQILGMAQPQRPFPEDHPPLGPGGGGFPPHGGPPYGHEPPYHDPPYGHEPPPHDPYGPYDHPPPYGPPHGGPPPMERGPGPMPRKRRWDGPDDRGPPPPYDHHYDDRGPPPPHYDDRGPPPPHYDDRPGPYRGPGGPPPPHWFDDRRGPPPMRGRMDGP